MQGRKKVLTATLSSLLVFAVMPAWAIMSVPNGWYAEGNVGTSRLSNKTYPGSASKSGLSGNLNVGYKLMPFAGIEIGYTYYSSTTIKASGVKAGTDKHYSYDIAAKGILPFSNTGFELFAKLGAARSSSQLRVNNATAAASVGLAASTHSAVGYYMGLGGQYYFMPEFALVAQWQRAVGDSKTGTLDLYSAGLSFLFS